MSNIKSMGEDVFINELAIIKYPSLLEIGNHVAIDNGVTISTELILGDYIHIAPYVCFIGGVRSKVLMANFSFIAAGSMIVAGSENYVGNGLVGPTIPSEYRDIIFSTIKFEKYAGCGVNCSIMPGVVLAEGSILGANSLLTKSTEPWTIYVGNPAKPIKVRKSNKILEYAKEMGY